MAPHRLGKPELIDGQVTEIITSEEIETTALRSRSTKTRPLVTGVDAFINEPGVARATKAISAEVPEGSKKEDFEKYGINFDEHNEYSVLQQHVRFWDRNGNGTISPIDTYNGFRALGFGIAYTIFSVLVINISFSYPTVLGHSFLPDPFFRIYVDTIHRSMHGSDSGILDMEGRFVPQAFENLFSKYDPTGTGSLSLSDLFHMMSGQRRTFDLFGFTAATYEWCTTWFLIQKDGRIYKEDLRRAFDGSLFWHIEAQRKTKEGWNQGWGFGGDRFWGSQKALPFSF